jgi:hypothetical protein
MAERDWTEILTTAGVTSCSSGAKVGTPFLLLAKGKPECAGKTMPRRITKLVGNKKSRKAFLMNLLYGVKPAPR